MVVNLLKTFIGAELKFALKDLGSTRRSFFPPKRLPKSTWKVFVFSTNVKSLGTFTGSRHDVIRSTSKINKLRAYGGTNINDALLDSVYSANAYKKAKGIKQVRIKRAKFFILIKWETKSVFQ